MLNRLYIWVSEKLHREDGQGLTEYALILVLVAIVVIIALRFLGTTVNQTISSVGSAVSAAPGTT